MTAAVVTLAIALAAAIGGLIAAGARLASTIAGRGDDRVRLAEAIADIERLDRDRRGLERQLVVAAEYERAAIARLEAEIRVQRDRETVLMKEVEKHAATDPGAARALWDRLHALPAAASAGDGDGAGGSGVAVPGGSAPAGGAASGSRG